FYFLKDGVPLWLKPGQERQLGEYEMTLGTVALQLRKRLDEVNADLKNGGTSARKSTSSTRAWRLRSFSWSAPSWSSVAGCYAATLSISSSCKPTWPRQPLSPPRKCCWMSSRPLLNAAACQ